MTCFLFFTSRIGGKYQTMSFRLMVVVPTQQEIMTVAGVYKTSPASSLCCVQLLGLLGMNIQAV